MPSIISSAISWADYDALSKDLAITFTNGKKYIYFDVPETVYRAFLDAASQGKFFNQFIEDVFKASEN